MRKPDRADAIFAGSTGIGFNAPMRLYRFIATADRRRFASSRPPSRSHRPATCAGPGAAARPRDGAIRPVLGERFRFEDLPDAHRPLASRRSVGRVVVDVAGAAGS